MESAARNLTQSASGRKCFTSGMKFSARRRWTKAEKWLFAAPLLVGIFALAMQFGPDMVRRKMGWPRELPTSSSETINGLALSRDGRVLAAGTIQRPPYQSSANLVHLWDARTLQPLPPFIRSPLATSGLSRDNSTYGVYLSPDGRRLMWNAFAFGLGSVDLTTRRPLWTIRTIVLETSASPDGRYLCYDHYFIIDGISGTSVARWRSGPDVGEPESCFSPDSRLFASTSGRDYFQKWQQSPDTRGGQIELRRVGEWKVIKTLALPNTCGMAFSPDAKLLLGVWRRYTVPATPGSMGTRLRCFDVQTGRVVWERDKTSQAAASASDWDWSREVQDVCFSPDGKYIAVALYTGAPMLLDAHTGAVVRSFRFYSSQENTLYLSGALAFSPNGKRLFARGQNAVLVWDLN